MPRHRLLEDVARLRQRALGRVHEEQHRVDHQERALHLAAEVGVARRVHDVQAEAVVVHGRLLGEDRDALLALEVARVHDPVHDGLVGAERAGLAEHRVDQRGLAVVHVRDDGDVAQVGADRGGHGGAGDGGVGHGARSVAYRRMERRPADRAAVASPSVTVAAVILSATAEGALADAQGQARVRRLADLAWSGGALPIVVVSPDPGRGRREGARRTPRRSMATRRRTRAVRSGRWCAAWSWPRPRSRDLDAALIWPARMTWVGPETITSLIEAHGTARGSVLRPAWHGDPGWPVLVPLAHLDALRAIAPDRMPPDVIADLAAVAPDPDRRARRSRRHLRHRHARGRPAGLRGPARSPRRAHPRVGRRRHRRSAAPRPSLKERPMRHPAAARVSRRPRRHGRSIPTLVTALLATVLVAALRWRVEPGRLGGGRRREPCPGGRRRRWRPSAGEPYDKAKVEGAVAALSALESYLYEGEDRPDRGQRHADPGRPWRGPDQAGAGPLGRVHGRRQHDRR